MHDGHYDISFVEQKVFNFNFNFKLFDTNGTNSIAKQNQYVEQKFCGHVAWEFGMRLHQSV